MPDKCCVPECCGNYDATKQRSDEKVSVFKFPDDPEMKAKWIRMIPRKDYVVTKNSVVCEKHFAAEFIVRFDVLKRPDGSVLREPRKRPKLTEDAFPSIFPHTPSYLTTEPGRKRKAPEDRRMEQDARDECIFNDWMCNDRISCFDEFCLRAADFVQGMAEIEWVVIQRLDYVCIYAVEFDDVPRLTVVIKIRQDMSIDVFKGQCRMSSESLQWVLGADCKLTNWSQLSSVLSHFASYVKGSCFCLIDQLQLVDQALNELIEMTDESDDYEPNIVSRLRFLREQISLLFKTQIRYSNEALIVAFRFFAISASVYRRLRSTVLSLPHVSYLKRLSSVFSMSGELNDSSHLEYLKQKVELLKPHEKHVILLLDEIYVAPKTSYKGGCLTGMASNSLVEQATTVQTFMFCSLLSRNKDVAAMVPVKNLTAAYLKDCTMKVISLLENAGYSVFCLISDNNRVNRNMFTDLCGGSLLPFIQHPCSTDRKLFFLFDSVHLLKSIRNNWLGQSDSEKTFSFPDITTDNVFKASFSHLRKLYESEKDSLVKLAPGLSTRVLYPSNIERQNVKTVLKVFDEKTIAGLQVFGVQNKIDVKGTLIFLENILKLWKILNVKSTDKGRRKRDIDSDPIRSVDSTNVIYLQQVHLWLCRWEKLNQKVRHGRLSNETMFALKHTVTTFIELIKYLFDDIKVSYVLTGKFQTDCLEFRFSQYRQFSGGTYNVSVQELKESEKKT